MNLTTRSESSESLADAPHEFRCRPGCGACCIALSISSPIPGLPAGKPASLPCPHLTPDYRCGIFHSPNRPKVCADLRPEPEMCGTCREEALAYLNRLERETRP